jgi:hypothetical protein
MILPPLLALSESRKVRVAARTALPMFKELPHHIAVTTFLKTTGSPDWQWTHMPSGKRRNARDAAKLKAMGCVRVGLAKSRGAM